MIESDIIQSIVLNSKIVVDTNNSVAFQLRLYIKIDQGTTSDGTTTLISHTKSVSL